MLRKKSISGILWGLLAAVVSSGLLAGFTPRGVGHEVRRRADTAVVRLQAGDMPAPIMNVAGGWSMRAPAASFAPRPGRDAQTPLRSGGQGIVFSETGLSIITEAGLRLVAGRVPDMHTPLPPGHLHDYDEFSGDEDHLSPWARAGMPAVCDAGDAVPLLGASAVLSRRPVAAPFSRDRRRYQPLVENFARRFGLNPALVYAIIQAESNFSPSLVSSRSAMGLMQLLPSTAGGEVHTFLHGRPGQMGFEDLSNPETNIRYGAAYLHLLLNRHLAAVRDPLSREYCAVASYNLGPNRFLRVFSEDRDAAIAKLNAMTPEQVFHQLTTTLPFFETRAFVAKVTRTRDEFALSENLSQ